MISKQTPIEITDNPTEFTLVSEDSREMYISLLELESLRQRIQRLRNSIGPIDQIKSLAGVASYQHRVVI